MGAIATDTRFRAAVSGAGSANLLAGYGTDEYIRDYEGEIGKPWVEEDLARYSTEPGLFNARTSQLQWPSIGSEHKTHPVAALYCKASISGATCSRTSLIWESLVLSSSIRAPFFPRRPATAALVLPAST